MLTCTRLRCEYEENPIGLDCVPRFFWQLQSERTDVLQTAYEIKVEGMWESGRVESADSIQITYGGSAAMDFTIDSGQSIQLTATPYPADAAVTFTWKSADESVFTVDQTGLVTGVGAGNARLTVSAGGVEQECIIRIR